MENGVVYRLNWEQPEGFGEPGERSRASHLFDRKRPHSRSVRRCRTTDANVRLSPNRTERAKAVLKGRNGFLELRSSESPLQSETRKDMEKGGFARKYHDSVGLKPKRTPESRGEAARVAHQTAASHPTRSMRSGPLLREVGLLSLTSSALSRSHRSCVCLSVLLLHCYPHSIRVNSGKMRYPSSLLSPCVRASVTTNWRFTGSSG